MKSLLALLTAALACIVMPTCGDTASSRISAGSYLKSDGDRDNDDRSSPIETVEKSDTLIPWTYGKEAGRADKRAITAFVKRYYAAAAAGDGARACSLLYSTLAAGLGEGQDQPLPSRTCAAVVSLLFEQQRQRLAADDVATMTVVDVRIEGDDGIATLGFRTMPVGQFRVKRERGAWKVDALLDTGMS
jgi:hypothetical protein